MKRLTAWIGGAAGGIALYRLWKRRPAEPATVDPADELRAKLAETREPEATPFFDEVAEPETPEERRRRVHEEGRSAIDEMQGE